jgi:hypothetical protein
LQNCGVLWNTMEITGLTSVITVVVPKWWDGRSPVSSLSIDILECSYCNVLSHGHRGTTATVETVELPQWQIIATNCRWVTTDEMKHVTAICKESFRSNGLPDTRNRTLKNGASYPVRKGPS